MFLPLLALLKPLMLRASSSWLRKKQGSTTKNENRQVAGNIRKHQCLNIHATSYDEMLRFDTIRTIVGLVIPAQEDQMRTNFAWRNMCGMTSWWFGLQTADLFSGIWAPNSCSNSALIIPPPLPARSQLWALYQRRWEHLKGMRE